MGAKALVVAALMQLAVAAPIGALFGAAYGTSIRIGYEIIFPALFKDKAPTQDAQGVLTAMNTMFTGIGGLEAQNFGINQGIKNALKAIDADPELTALIKKNSNLDTQTITVNLSGTSTQASSELSQSSLSDIDVIPDTTGGTADRQSDMRKALAEAKASNNRTAASTIYRNAISLAERVPPSEKIRELFSKGSFEWFSLTWNLALMDAALQQSMFKLAQEQETEGGGRTFEEVEARRAAADAARESEIKAFGDTKLEFTQTQQGLIDRANQQLIKPKAGQTQKLERQRLFTLIGRVANVLKSIPFSGTHKGLFIRTRAELKHHQAALATLLQRYRWI